MHINLIKKLIKSGKKFEVSLKSGSTIAKITFKRTNKDGYVEAVQSEKGAVNVHYFFNASDIEAVSCEESFDFLF